MTSTEVSTALRPFYFSVHPDLFGQHPNQRTTNENSLKQLSSLLETLQNRRRFPPCTLQFYIRDKNKHEQSFKLINIYFNNRDIRETILTILRSCNLPTEYVDKIPKAIEKNESSFLNNNPFNNNERDSFRKDPFSKGPFRSQFNEDYFTEAMENDPIFGVFFVKRKITKERDSQRLGKWIEENYRNALDISELYRPLREELERLRKSLSERWGILEVRWDCGWNESHFKGCLQSLNALADQYPEKMQILRGRVLVFAPFTGVSLDGHIMLNSGEVRHNWLDVRIISLFYLLIFL